jgi:hypothetical protein
MKRFVLLAHYSNKLLRQGGTIVTYPKTSSLAQCKARADGETMLNPRYLLFLAASLMLIATPSPCRPAPGQEGKQEESPAAKAQAAEREAWRKSMVRTPLPKNGCFKASFPNKAWQEVRCLPPSPYPNRPKQRGGLKPGPNTVGAGNGDWSAVSAGTISSAEGSFNSVDVTVGPDTNVFMLQLNTQFFNNPPACNNVAGCQGWQQFLYSPTQCPGGPCVFMEYWLIGIGTCPPATATQPWQASDGGCFYNTFGSPVTIPTVAQLTGVILSATASAGGQDTAVFGPIGGTLNAVGQDSVLSLANFWNTAEFNVFGDCCGKQTAFNNPTTLVLKTTINDGTTNAPTCVNQSFTGETNNLNLATVTGSATLVCCPYGGASPAIEFMETSATPPHTAICGPTQLEGDPHITTADGSHYDFQAAGEFISLRDSDGSEIQTRQKPVSTTFIGTDGHDGLTTCVSLNSAVATRVGEHRVTYEPNLSGVPDPSGLQLRIDGALTVPGPAGIDLGNGGRVVKSFTGGNLEIDFPDGKTLFVTPEWWASQSEWYLNVDVTHLGLMNGAVGAYPRGIAGPIPVGSWIPALPNGTSMGPMPGPMQERYDALYHKFADAWRVTVKDSLFDYAPGTSTGTFTMKNWPLEKPPCVVPETKPVEPGSEALAKEACQRVFDPNRHADCVFDVMATGNAGFAKTYLATQRILADSTTISLTDDAQPSQVGERVTFTAFVAANSTRATGYPSGTVQFAVDGSNVGAPVMIDAKGRATWETSGLKVGMHRVTASYLPGTDSVFLPSVSVEKIHIVRRCPCADEHEHK